MEVKKGEKSKVLKNMSEVISYKGHQTTKAVLEHCYSIVGDCIGEMNPDALSELTSGNENDLDSIIDEMVYETFKIVYKNQINVNNNHLSTLSSVNQSLEEAFKIQSMNYFVHSMFGDDVDINWHHLEWGLLAEEYNNIAILASRDHGKSFWWSELFPIWKMYRYKPKEGNGRWQKEGFIFSYTDKKASDILAGIKSRIESHPILKDKLFRYTKEGWAATKIITKNGCEVNVSGLFGGTRGFHPHWIVSDDLLKDEVMYSPGQREKSIEQFKSVIMQMLVPDGQHIVIGTPFHQQDLYSIFKTPSGRRQWAYREYPAIFPNGKLLWEDRYSYTRLMDRKEFVGNVTFSREFLLKPIASDASLFPMEMIRSSIIGMEKYTLVNNVEAFPIKFEYIVSGHDFSISQSMKADYTVYTVWGVDESGCMWLLWAWRKQGATFHEQINMLKSVWVNFRPTIMILENNVFQEIYNQVLQDTDMPIKPHTTGKQKHSEKVGLPAMTIMFERKKIKFPYGDERSRNFADITLAEFNNITWTDRGARSVAGHDDIAMSTWQARIGTFVMEESGFNYSFL